MTAQELQAERLKIGSFNNLDGEAVVKLLADNKELWRGYVFGRFDDCGELIELRDIENGVNADTLMISPKDGKEKDLELLAAKHFEADEVDYLSDEEASKKLGSWPAKQKVLRVWWD